MRGYRRCDSIQCLLGDVRNGVRNYPECFGDDLSITNIRAALELLHCGMCGVFDDLSTPPLPFCSRVLKQKAIEFSV